MIGVEGEARTRNRVDDEGIAGRDGHRAALSVETVGEAPAQGADPAAGATACLEDRHLVSRLVELEARGEAGEAGAENQDSPARRLALSGPGGNGHAARERRHCSQTQADSIATAGSETRLVEAPVGRRRPPACTHVRLARPVSVSSLSRIRTSEPSTRKRSSPPSNQGPGLTTRERPMVSRPTPSWMCPQTTRSG